LITETLEPVFEEKYVVAESVLHGQFRGDALALSKGYTSMPFGERCN
jgi:hypothetical protein